MLDEPESLTDYNTRLFHSGDGIWIDFGVSCGETYFDEGMNVDT